MEEGKWNTDLDGSDGLDGSEGSLACTIPRGLFLIRGNPCNPLNPRSIPPDQLTINTTGSETSPPGF